VKLEPITGISADSQVLQLYNGDTMVTSIEGDDYMIGDFPVDNFMTLKVTQLYSLFLIDIAFSIKEFYLPIFFKKI